MSGSTKRVRGTRGCCVVRRRAPSPIAHLRARWITWLGRLCARPRGRRASRPCARPKTPSECAAHLRNRRKRWCGSADIACESARSGPPRGGDMGRIHGRSRLRRGAPPQRLEDQPLQRHLGSLRRESSIHRRVRDRRLPSQPGQCRPRLRAKNRRVELAHDLDLGAGYRSRPRVGCAHVGAGVRDRSCPTGRIPRKAAAVHPRRGAGIHVRIGTHRDDRRRRARTGHRPADRRRLTSQRVLERINPRLAGLSSSLAECCQANSTWRCRMIRPLAY